MQMDWQQKELQKYNEIKEETTIQKLKRKITSNPFVPLGFLGTVYMMGRMIRLNRRGDKLGFIQAQRYRIALSFFTIGCATIGYYYDHQDRLESDFKIKFNKE
ncbi:hypothetical protein HK103_006512 [Boothiomyces macroporosus]|uniref:HIG1 domain-containing protein n=1 Tax=Boothiomyces macroporosus TaxID=261099 RepID=A0AAD5UNC5_9FUNG|nr:hypothetical protein HK103_006512 [Boothiomyces macroporosus]